jgi:hypothetical protein
MMINMHENKLKLETVLDFESAEFKADYEKFRDEVGIYFFILRVERNLKTTPIERLLKITPGVIQEIEAGRLNWSTTMLEDMWNYYFSLPIKYDILSRFNVNKKNGVLAHLVKIGLKRNKRLQKRKEALK